MSDLISRKALLERLEKIYGTDSIIDKIMLRFLKKLIRKQPTVDAVEVVHGRWSMVKMGEKRALAKCSACGRKMNPSQYGYAYCGLCGAKMDGGDEE